MIAPLTANTLAKLAHGIADNVLTEAVLAHNGADPRRAGDEPAHVVERGHAGERRHARGARRRARRPGRGRDGRGRVGSRADGRAGGDLHPRPAAARAGPARGPARARHRRRDAGAGRLGALRRKPLVRTHGRRARRGGEAAWSRRDAAGREPRRSAARARRDRSTRRPPRRCATPRSRARTSTSP